MKSKSFSVKTIVYLSLNLLVMVNFIVRGNL